jgi:nucleotide-binding universal stress UspA family protein
MVPLDGSARAEQALAPAVRLAAATGASLQLVRVTDLASSLSVLPASVYLPEQVLEDETAQASTYLDALQKRMTAEGVRSETHLLTGSPALALLDFEQTAHIDLTVMCSHGRSGIARFALGSVADRLLRHGSTPLLLVQAFGPALDLEHGIVPLDGSSPAEQVLFLVESLAASPLREVILLHAADSEPDRAHAQDYLAFIAQRLRVRGLVCHVQVVHEDPAQAILNAAHQGSLVIMGTHGRTGLARWALGSVADRVTHGGAAGVLLVRTAGDAGQTRARWTSVAERRAKANAGEPHPVQDPASPQP